MSDAREALVEVEAIASELEAHANVASRPGQRESLHELAERVRRLAALSDPEVLAGMAEVLREHSESKGDASFLPSCRCGWVGASRMAWVADLARHQATALADWLRGQG